MKSIKKNIFVFLNKIKKKVIHLSIIKYIIYIILVYILVKNKFFLFQIFNFRNIEHILLQSISFIQDSLKNTPKLFLNYFHMFDLNKLIFHNLRNKIYEILYIVHCTIFFTSTMIYIDSNKKNTINQIPNNIKKFIKNLLIKIHNNLINFVTAKLVESFFIFLFSSFGYYLLGLNSWFFLGLYMSILNNIPFIGPIFGTVLPVAIGLANSMYQAINVFFVCILVQIIDNLYLIPFIVSDKIKVNPLISIFMVLTCSQIFGSIGMIFALPLYLIYKTILTETYYFVLKNIYNKNN